MTSTMHAAVVVAFGQPLQLQELPVPAAGPSQVLVKTEACGVCHTDLYAAAGDWSLKPGLPFIPGHEGIGTVVALGSGVTAVKEGDRVGVPWLYSACGHCEYCLSAASRSVRRRNSVATLKMGEVQTSSWPIQIMWLIFRLA